MTNQWISFLVTTLVLVGDASAAEVVVTGIKAAMVDCYANSERKQSQGGSIRKKDWPAQRLIAEQHTPDAVHLTVAGRQCWFDRDALKIEVPKPTECVSGDLHGSRGAGDPPQCAEPKKRGRK
jgi:hypothetical protein